MCENVSGEIQTHTGMVEFTNIFCFTIGYKKASWTKQSYYNNTTLVIIQLLVIKCKLFV
jgi:hypothetical protein